MLIRQLNVESDYDLADLVDDSRNLAVYERILFNLESWQNPKTSIY